MKCNRKFACECPLHHLHTISDCSHSADYLCCVEPDQQPRFKFHPLSKYPILNEIAASSVEVPIGFQNLLSIVALDPEYLDILTDVEQFCTSFRLAKQIHGSRRTLKPHDYDVTPLRYRLLCMENARKTSTYYELVGDACRIGTLVFIKTVFDQFGCWGPTHKVWGRPYRFIVEKLKVYLTRLDHCADALRTEFMELLLWLSFMGGVLQLEYGNRKWYNSHIATTAAKLRLSCFEEVKVVLSKFLWIEWVHENTCKTLWEDIRSDSEIQKVARPDWGIAAQSL
jgi:hypothetical protein